MNSPDMLEALRRAGLLHAQSPVVTPLAGGVSCDILLVDDGGRRIVVKRALEKLRVKDDWFADTSRNFFEQAYMRYANSVLPGCVPRILLADAERKFFAMEFLGEGWGNWKSELLGGRIEPRYAVTAGATLAAIHAASWGDTGLAEQFATTPNFMQLRIDPYLLTTGKRNPALEPFFQAEAERLAGTSLALVHGDFSPKNILLEAATARIAILDCEVAWFGDPAFDIAFFLNHLLLKALHLPERQDGFLSLADTFLSAYRSGLGERFSAELEARTTRLLLMLLLARVDGKSPVEYLACKTEKQNLIRKFVTRTLPRPPRTFAELAEQFKDAIPTS